MWLILRGNFIMHLKRSDDLFIFYVSNLKQMWHTQLSSVELVKKFKELNPMFEMKDSVICEKIADLFSKTSNEGCHTIDITSDGRVEVKTTQSIKGFSYKMELSLDMAEQEQFLNEFFIPVIHLLSSFKEREKELVSIIEAKDVELEEYRLEGIELKRPGITTAPFSYETFLKAAVKVPEVAHPVELLKGPLQEMLSPSSETAKPEPEATPVSVIRKKEKTRVLADVKSISGTGGCLYSAKPSDATNSANVRRRKIPTRTVKL